MDRIKRFLLLKGRKEEKRRKNPNLKRGEIAIKNCSFYTSNDKREINRILKNVTLSINKGDFVCISGPTSSGKTVLLDSLSKYYIIGNSGSFIVNGTCSYSSQIP